MFEGDDYHKCLWNNKGMPKIAGSPELEVTKYVPYVKGKFRGSYGRKIIIPGFLKTPAECDITRLMSWEWREWGAPLLVILATYGYGKSNLMNYLLSCFNAVGVKILMFDNMEFEARNIAMSGHWNKKNEFIPNALDVYVPRGYKFAKGSNPLWKHRNNVNKIEWDSVDDIINNLQNNHFAVIYAECFNHAGQIALWNDLIYKLRRTNTKKERFMFAHHEFGELFPPTPTGDVYKLVLRSSRIAKKLRKNFIGLLTIDQSPSDLFYMHMQKYLITINKRPTNRKGLSQAEASAKRYNRQGFNIEVSGYFRPHKIGKFPEMPPLYDLVSQDYEITYPEFNEIILDSDSDTSEEIEMTKEERVKILKDEYKLTYRQIGGVLGIDHTTAWNLYQKSKKLPKIL